MRRIGPADQRPLTDLASWDRRVFHESKSRDFVAEHELSARRLLFLQREPLLDRYLIPLDARQGDFLQRSVHSVEVCRDMVGHSAQRPCR